MSNRRDYYEVLGVNKTATQKEISKAYKKLAITHHPDKQHGKSEDVKKVSEDKFKEINEANDVLSDPEKRKLYDQFGHDMGRNNGFGNVDPNDLFERMTREHFGGMHGFKRDPRENANIHVNFSITLEEVISKTPISKKFRYNRLHVCVSCQGKGGSDIVTCNHCGGTGMQTFQRGNMLFQQTCQHCRGVGSVINNICGTCNGSGNTVKNEQIDIDIPVGSIFNQVRLNDKGNEIIVNGNKYVGILTIQIIPKPHQEYEIDNQGNLHKTIEVSVIDCIVGDKVKFKYLDGSDKQFNLKQGTREGENFRLNLGVPTPNGNITDLYIHIKHKFPDKLTEEQIKTLKTIKI